MTAPTSDERREVADEWDEEEEELEHKREEKRLYKWLGA